MLRVVSVLLLAVIYFTSLTVAAQEAAPEIRCHNYNKIILATDIKSKYSRAENSRSDSIDILHYEINLDISDLSSQSVAGYCRINFTPKADNINELLLDLLSLQVDSVLYQSQQLSYTHSNELLKVVLPASLNSSDTAEVTVFYGGNPVKDASGWGGFYFQGNYAFNLGVGFAADPHNYGRVWFPCFDNFAERSTYEFYITTDTAHKAYCNGLLQSDLDNGDGTITWHWKLDQTIPTYLASVAVSNYEEVNMTYSKEAVNIPVILAARPSDTAKMRSSFVNFLPGMEGFIESYGPYQWDRVGFNLVPFSSGAMEHATNIAYPAAAANGSLTYETLMAHEFAHHWWGDLVTCETAEDMWINEGWASYSEAIFLEKVYGKQKYKDYTRSNHEYVLMNAHIDDNGYRAVSGVPHEYTYGTHVYQKGADVAHTLRGYMVDQLFFQCITSFLSEYAFKDVKSVEFRNYLSNCSGIDLSAYFENWIFNPGFPHFSIDSFVVQDNDGNFTTEIYIRQRLKKAPAYFNEVPLELTVMDDNLNAETITVMMNGPCEIFSVSTNFKPTYAAIDMEEKISDAITDKYIVIDSTGDYNFDEGQMTMNVSSAGFENLVRVTHSWIPPDRFRSGQDSIFLSPERYWNIDGIFSPGFSASAIVKYSFNTDKELLQNSSPDDLLLVYRENTSSEWSEYTDYSINKISRAITINDIKKGEYALAAYSDMPDTLTSEIPQNCKVSGISNKEEMPAPIYFPNPADKFVQINFRSEAENISIIDIFGNEVFDEKVEGQHSVRIDLSALKAGVYFITTKARKKIFSEKLIVIH